MLAEPMKGWTDIWECSGKQKTCSSFSSISLLTMRPLLDFSKLLYSWFSICSRYKCMPLSSKSFLTLSIHLFLCLPLLLSPLTCPCSAAFDSLFPSILSICPMHTSSLLLNRRYSRFLRSFRRLTTWVFSIQGRPSPLRPWCFSPLVSDFPLFSKNVQTLENFQNFTFSRKISPFSSTKISDDLF